MNVLTLIILIFSIVGAIDKIFENRLGLGKEFEQAFMLLGTLALSMTGMIVMSPVIAKIIQPFSEVFARVTGIDPSIIPASLLANDMGGAALSAEMSINSQTGLFNALIVSSMMGCTISYTIPFALGMVNKEQHKELMLGLLCGIVTIPIGCFIAGIICRISIVSLLILLIPLIIFSLFVAFGLVKYPELCVKVFKCFGLFVTVLITIGLVLGIIKFLTGIEIIHGISTIEEGMYICINAAIVLSGAFPFMCVLSKLLSKQIKIISDKLGINEHSVLGIISCLVTSATTFGLMNKMDKKGVVLNSAFAVSGAFVFGGHLAFTMAFDKAYIWPMIIGKIVSGLSALLLANMIYFKNSKSH